MIHLSVGLSQTHWMVRWPLFCLLLVTCQTFTLPSKKFQNCRVSQPKPRQSEYYCQLHFIFSVSWWQSFGLKFWMQLTHTIRCYRLRMWPQMSKYEIWWLSWFIWRLWEISYHQFMKKQRQLPVRCALIHVYPSPKLIREKGERFFDENDSDTVTESVDAIAETKFWEEIFL